MTYRTIDNCTDEICTRQIGVQQYDGIRYDRHVLPKRGGGVNAQPDQSISVEDYLFAERKGPDKHEYYAGRGYAMSGASARHNGIAGSTYAALYAQLRKRD